MIHLPLRYHDDDSFRDSMDTDDASSYIQLKSASYIQWKSIAWTNEWYLDQAKRILYLVTGGAVAWWKYEPIGHLTPYDVSPSTMTDRFKNIVMDWLQEETEREKKDAENEIEADRRRAESQVDSERRDAQVAAEASALICAGIDRLRKYENTSLGKHVTIPGVDELVLGLQNVVRVADDIALRLCRQRDESMKRKRTDECPRCGLDKGDDAAERRTRARCD